MSADFNTEFALTRLVHLSARCLDDNNYNDFLQMFTHEGQYSITCNAPELPEKMIWMQQTRSELAERIQAMTEHEWEIVLVEQTRVVSVDSIRLDDNHAELSSSFALYHTEQSGKTMPYAVGRYEDHWIRNTDKWLLASREVALRTRVLEILSPLPI